MCLIYQIRSGECGCGPYSAEDVGITLSCQWHRSSHPLSAHAVQTGLLPSQPVLRARQGLQARRTFRRRWAGRPLSEMKVWSDASMVRPGGLVASR
jgi:hypothetical protein